VKDQNRENAYASLSLHQRLSDVCSSFRILQQKFLSTAGPEQGARLEHIATLLIWLCEERIEQVLGELFLSEHSYYTFTKPLYVAASLTELIRRYSMIETPIDNDRRLQMVMAALGYNLGLLAYESQVYDNSKEFSAEERKHLREHYPQQSADMLNAAGLDHAVLQDIVLNHNLAADNPSKDAMMMRVPFIYAGIALPQQPGRKQQSMKNPSREFAKMYANGELDPVFGALYLKINGVAPIGSIIEYKSHEQAIVVHGPGDEDILSSTVRMLADGDGNQLDRPGERYPFNETPTRHRGVVDHHHFAWEKFPPHVMWED
jgi:hypothetical protein